MRVIKIDVETQSVSELNIESNIETFYKEISCETIEKLDLVTGHHMLFDEEAGIVFPQKKKFIINVGFYFPVIGNVLIVGVSEDGGYWTDCTLDIEHIRKRVKFL